MNILTRFLYNKRAIVFLALIFLLKESNQKFSYGFCKPIEYDTNLTNLELPSYLGKWYELIRLSSTPFEKGHCTVAEYSINERGNIKVDNTENRNGIINKAIGEAKFTEDINRLSVSFGESWWNYLLKGEYKILKTDYKNYSIVYSCNQFLFLKFEFVWLLVRDPHNNNDKRVEEFTNYVKNKLGIDKSELFYTKHDEEHCFVKKNFGNEEI